MGKCNSGSHPSLADQIGLPASCGTHLVLSNRTDTGLELLCSAFCTVGVARSCGWDGVTLPMPTLCQGQAVGDQGTCVRLCDCDSDCATSLGCLPLAAASQVATGRRRVLLLEG
jgi:hypothetical protein